jgi:hypothetical protein
MQEIREFQYSPDRLVVFTTEACVASFPTDMVSGREKRHDTILQP